VSRLSHFLWLTVFLGVALGISASFAPAQGVSRCPLNIRRVGQRVERPDPAAEGAIVAFLGGPVTVTCGDAVMTGDSAEWRQAIEQALMIGNVRYRDTTRTLNSERLTFRGARDEIVAVGDVRLVRIATGAMLEGPRVTFTRTPIAGSRTVATERPRMTLPSGRDEAGTGQSTIVDADVAEFIGESEASASGSIVMIRGDVRATAERARFSETAARAVLYEDAVIIGEGFDLAGDSIAAGFELGELRTIHAFESARASGSRFELQADQIRARLAGDQIDVIWAFGEGRSLAGSSQFTLVGDSIEFAFLDGRADSVAAVGSAAAEQRADSTEVVRGELIEPDLGISPGASWIAGDTVRAWFEPEDELLPAAPAQSESEPADARIRRLRAVGDARSFYAAVRDSTRSLDPSRNYLLGSEIEINFEAGEPSTLSGVDAIGVFLEPVEEGEGG
jgi:lipopolysaccharide export system protein LptA